MDAKVVYRDNMFIARLWRTVEYEGVYLKAYQDGRDARYGMGDYFRFCNSVRPHQPLGYPTPAKVFISSPVEASHGGLIQSLISGPLRTPGTSLNAGLIPSNWWGPAHPLSKGITLLLECVIICSVTKRGNSEETCMDSDAVPELHTIWSEAKERVEQGDYDKAAEIYKYVLIRYGDNDIALEHANAYLGDIYLTLRRLDLAENHIKKAINCKPDKPSYHYLLGFTYSIQRRWGKAISEFEIAVDKEPYNSEYSRGLGWAIHCAGDKAKGLAYLHRAIDLAPTDVNILTDLAAAYLSDLEFHKARQYAETAIGIDPDSNLARELLDNIDRLQRDHGQFGEP